MPRLLRIDPAQYPEKLDSADECYHIGEYTSRGGYGASETNRLITNLKKRPSSTPHELRYKESAIVHWGNTLAKHLDLAAIAAGVTFVPAPCSKPYGHPEHDDRMLRVLRQMARTHTGGSLDIRPLLITPVARQSQHEGERMSVDSLRNSMAIDQAQLQTPVRSTLILVDDVFTRGGTFKAMQGLLAPLPNVRRIVGVFLAKTIWPSPFTDDALDQMLCDS
jgi:hypothetical protein